jgi:membrane-associated phospholipid phosphatase
MLRLLLSLALLAASPAFAGSGPLGIDHRWSYDNSGIWKRSTQNLLQYGGPLADFAFAAWEGGETRLGRAAWQSVDSMALSAVAANVAKPVFGRERPAQTDDPNQWFKGGHSFPSGEVATVAGIVTPYVLEYRHDYPAVYALELLPAYDAVARMKLQAHWQTDVLASFALGTAAGYFAHERESPFILGLLPGGFSVGFKKSF